MSFCCNHHFIAGQSDFNNCDHHKFHRSGKKDDFLQSLVGKIVKINRGGPDSLTGKLLAVKSDYLVLKTREGIVYVATRHVKSITEIGCNKTGGNRSCKRDPEFIKADNFNGVLRALHQKFVQINSGGPEKIKGFVSQVNDTSTLVVSGKEAILVQNDHIRNIMEVDCKKTGGNKNDNEYRIENRNENKKDNKKDNKSYKTQGNRSGGKNRS